MTIKTNIEKIDIQGEGKKVLTEYQPHTISIVGEGALGINLTKVKSKNSFLETKGGAELMAKVNKAKALDAEPKEPKESVVTKDVAPVVPVDDSVDVESKDGTKGSEELTDGTVDVAPEPEVDKQVSEDVTKVTAEIKDQVEAEPVVSKETNELDQELGDGVEIEQGEKTNKAKAYTVDEVIQSQKDALDGVNQIFKKIQSTLPDANIWDVSELIYDAIYRVEDAAWNAKDSLWDDIYTEVYEEVNTRVNKAKSLKVEAEGTPENKLKSALALLSPEMAQIVISEIETNKSKALEAETERNKTIRAKALEQGAEKFKRIATEENTTDMITDAMLSVEISAPEEYKVIAKALETASLLTMAGNLFPDVGSSASLQVQTESDYVSEKAKSLVEKEGGNLAAARATVRQSEEFQTLYG